MRRWGEGISNLYNCELNGSYEGGKKKYQFNLSEQWYQFHKARMSDDGEACTRILQTKTGWEAKREGEKVRAVPAWFDQRRGIMRKILGYKWYQCASSHRSLQDTGDRVLVEDTANDYWARGPKGEGRSVMGCILMEIREEGRVRHEGGIQGQVRKEVGGEGNGSGLVIGMKLGGEGMAKGTHAQGEKGHRKEGVMNIGDSILRDEKIIQGMDVGGMDVGVRAYSGARSARAKALFKMRANDWDGWQEGSIGRVRYRNAGCATQVKKTLTMS